MRASVRKKIINTYIEQKVQIVSYEHVAGLAACNNSLYVYMHGIDFCVFILFKRRVASSLIEIYTKESAKFRLKIDICKIVNND